jgi:hypothetical protein
MAEALLISVKFKPAFRPNWAVVVNGPAHSSARSKFFIVHILGVIG